jgi:hypothetical protein
LPIISAEFFIHIFYALAGMPTMTAKQPFRDSKLDGKKSVGAGSKSTPLVVQLTRKIAAPPYLGTVHRETPEPVKIGRDAQDDSDLPSFPGESWFGG